MSKLMNVLLGILCIGLVVGTVRALDNQPTANAPVANVQHVAATPLPVAAEPPATPTAMGDIVLVPDVNATLDPTWNPFDATGDHEQCWTDYPPNNHIIVCDFSATATTTAHQTRTYYEFSEPQCLMLAGLVAKDQLASDAVFDPSSLCMAYPSIRALHNPRNRS